MAKYTSKPATVDMAFADLTERLSDFSRLQSKLDELPAERKAQIGDVTFTTDSIDIVTPQVGQISLKATERRPGHLSLTAAKSPVPMALSLNYEAQGSDKSSVVAEIDVELPAMLRPLVGPALQKAVDQMGAMFTTLL